MTGGRIEWFQWERQATVHPIVLCMEAWMEPIKKKYGRPWPTTVIIYKNDLVGWYNKWPELLEYGQYLIDRFMDKSKLAELDWDIKKQTEDLEATFERFDSINLRDLSDGHIVEKYEEIRKKWVIWFTPGGITEPIGYQGEKLLENRLHGAENSSKIISTITTSSGESFSKRELREFLIIVAAKKEGKNVDKLLEQHATKYYWLHNNYFTTEVLDYHFFLNELKTALDKYSDPSEQIEKMEMEALQAQKEKEQIMAELNFSEKEKALVELLDKFAWYQDRRKEYTMRMLHYLDMILAEIGSRKGIPVKEMKYSVPTEISTIMAGKMDRKILLERMKRCLFYWDAENGKFEFGSGQFSIEKEKEIFHSIMHKEGTVEVNGMVASNGIVRGMARVTMSAKIANEIKKGEILITSMTTPDFVTAMKRAAAIVTNEGGVLCHAAVVSREFGIPCIVGTGIATKIFKTGDLIEVDGSLGVVRKIR